jgi:PAS domain S-box-containing protein
MERETRSADLPGMRRLVLRVYLCLGAALVAAAAAARPGSATATALFFVAGGGAFTAAAVGVRLHRPPYRRLWYTLLATDLAFVGAGAIATALVGTPTPRTSVVDLAFLPGYALLAWMVISLARRAGSGGLAGSDAVIGTLALGAVLWSVALDPNFEHLGDPGHAVAATFALSDLVLVAVVLRVLLSAAASVRAFRLLCGAALVMLASDLVDASPKLTGSALLHALSAAYVAAFVLGGASTLHPSVRSVVDAEEERAPSTGRTLGVVTLALLALPLGFILNKLIDPSPDLALYAGLSVAVIAAVAMRIGRVLAQFDQLRRRAELSEQRFRTVFDSAGLGISIGKGGFMTETNPTYQRMLGYTAEELSRMHYSEISHPDDAEMDVEAMDDVMAGDRPLHSFEKRYVRKDGTTFIAEVTLSRARDGSFGIALVEDITARKELEAELRQAQKMEAVGQLAGGIAHDFNNLMTAVNGYAEILRGEIDANDGRRQRVDAIAEAAMRAADLTRQLLAFSRRQVLRPEPTELADVVAALETILRRLLPANVELVVDTRAGATAQVDSSQLEQVVLNLALNARDAMPDGGTLTISVRGVGDVVELAVADDGIGMDEETQRRIFEPFFTTKPVGAGTGLGLSMVEGIVAQSGGSVAVATKLGRGSVFTVRLPRVDASTVDADAGAGTPPTPSHAGVVLLAEDEEIVRRVTVELLRRLDYDVVATASGEDALELLERGEVEPDVLVSDVVMTGMDGRTLAERARVLVPSLPVLFISGYSAQALSSDRHLDDAVLLTKPFTATELADRIERVRRRGTTLVA